MKRCLATILLTLSVVCLYPQDRTTRLAAVNAFERKHYEEAYSQFVELSTSFPRDPLYKYYVGVCLLQMNSDLENARTNLEEARKLTTVSRPIPDDVDFYYGRVLQLLGAFPDAITAYNAFTDKAGKKVAKSYGTPTYISECVKRVGSVVNTRVSTNPSVVEEELENTATELSDNTVMHIRQYDDVLDEALEYQRLSDSLTMLALEKRGSTSLSEDEKADISKLESLSDSLQRLADEKFVVAQNAMNAASSERIEQATSNLETTPRMIMMNSDLDVVDVQQTINVQDSSISAVIANSMQVASGVTSMFEVNSSLATSNDPVAVNPELPQGLIYRIQVAILSNPATMSTFRGLSPVYGIRDGGSSTTKYFVGLFRKRVDANSALVEVKKAGFRDAFVVCLLSGNTISGERAASLEKEWESVPFAYTDRGITEVETDTVPPVLSYRVEFYRSKQPASEEALNLMKTIAGDKGLSIFTLEDGNIVYLVGQFVSYESASEYSSLVARNGFADAKVSAWLGKKEIPVETAKQLFDMI